MDFETFVKSLVTYLKEGDNLYYLLYAAATCLLTQVIKKLFLDKTKVEVLHKFNFAELLPFLWGLVFAAVDVAAVRRVPFSWNFAAQLIMSAATIGALASVIYKFASSLSGKSLKTLMKDDVFGVFYTQLLYFGNTRQQLLDKQLTMENFISLVKSLAESAAEIYGGELSEEQKKQQLRALLETVVDQSEVDACTDMIAKALSQFTQK